MSETVGKSRATKMIEAVKEAQDDKIDISSFAEEGTSLFDQSKEDETESIEQGRYSHYNFVGNGKYIAYNEQNTKRKALPSGLYSIYQDMFNNNQIVFHRSKFQTDELYDLPIKELDLIKNDISKFWSTEKKFKEYGLVHKRGILLYGKPGCGKSCAIQVIMKDLIENHNGLIFKISNSNDLSNFISQFNPVIRVIEPNRRVVVMLEDIDGLFLEASSTQTKLLNLLDGINQSSNIVYVGTTNYPERLEERILNRPSRFDKRYEFRLPNAEIRLAYLKNSLKPNDLKNIDLQEWVDKSEGLTLSHLRELIVSVIILENDFDTEVQTLKDMGNVISSASYRTSGVAGFKAAPITIGGFGSVTENKEGMKCGIGYEKSEDEQSHKE